MISCTYKNNNILEKYLAESDLGLDLGKRHISILSTKKRHMDVGGSGVGACDVSR